MQDKIVTCDHCGSLYCYEVNNNGIVSNACLTCGFETNTELLDGSIIQQELETTMPAIFKNLKYVDKRNRAWYPKSIHVEEIGVIFPDLTQDGKDWCWAFAPAIPVEPGEKIPSQKEGEFAKFKPNMYAVIHFNKNEFAKAIEAIGLL